MAKIQSTTELLFNARTGKTGIIRIEIANWQYDVNNKIYTAIVNDFLVEPIEEDEVYFERLTPIASKNSIYPKEQIDALFLALQNPIEIEESYTEEMDFLISQALLYVTQSDPIYGSSASDWEIFGNPLERKSKSK
jgi:hypothetical protein